MGGLEELLPPPPFLFVIYEKKIINDPYFLSFINLVLIGEAILETNYGFQFLGEPTEAQNKVKEGRARNRAPAPWFSGVGV